MLNANPASAEDVPPGMDGLPRVPPYFLLDAWRGVAALWVVMLHACYPYIVSGHGSLARNPVYGVSLRGQLGVTIFFVISGYCITGAVYNAIAARKSLARFCADRLRRIYPPYLLALALAVALAGLTQFLRGHLHLEDDHHVHESLPANAAYWIANVTLMQAPVGYHSALLVAWSLCFEVAFYGVMACFLLAGRWWPGDRRERPVAVLTAGVGGATVGSLGWLCVSPATCPYPFQLWYQFGLGALLFLWFAVGPARHGMPLHSLRTGVCAALGSAVMLAVVFAALHPGPAESVVGSPSLRIQVGTTLVFCALLLWGRRYDALLVRSRITVALTRLGVISYSLYLVHVPLLPFVDGGLRRLGFVGEWYGVTYAAQILVGLGAGWAFFVLAERRFISGRQVRRIARESSPDATLPPVLAHARKSRTAVP